MRSNEGCRCIYEDVRIKQSRKIEVRVCNSKCSKRSILDIFFLLLALCDITMSTGAPPTSWLRGAANHQEVGVSKRLGELKQFIPDKKQI